MNRIGIIGHFGGDKEFYDGQTIKTKNLKAILESNRDEMIYCVDTYLNSGHKIKLLAKTLVCLFSCKTIFILLSENGIGFYLPFLHYANKLFKRQIFHYIIGSELLTMVSKKPKLVKYLNSLQKNWFEYPSGTQFLQSQGVRNAYTLPNCKNLCAVEETSITSYTDPLLRFCTFSRVMPEKGITDAILAAAQINEQYGSRVVCVDIYGIVDDAYAEEFAGLLKQYPESAAYCGVVDSGKSVETIKNYFALLFPTRWVGEGFPGTILDAFASAVPVIASDWNANKELIEHGKTGLIYPREGIDDLQSAIIWAKNNVDKMNAMRIQSRLEFEKYTPQQIGAVISKAIDEGVMYEQK